MIMTADKLARQEQDGRCRRALKILEVPDNVLFSLSGPLLWQLAHLCCVIDEPMHWRDAVRWMQEHKGEIMAHAQQVEREKHEQRGDAAGGAD